MLTTCGHEIDASSGANNDDVANDLMTAFGDNIMPQLNANYELQGVTCYIGQDAPSSLIATSSLPAVAGSKGTDAVPQNTAYLVRKRTDLAGRRGRGRMYIPSVIDTEVDDQGRLTTASQLSWTTSLDNWMADLTTAVGARLYPPVVLHRSEGIGVEPLPTPVQSFVIDPVVATQRRRLRP